MANEPELSETLQLLDEKERELLCRQQSRVNLPLSTRILYLSSKFFGSLLTYFLLFNLLISSFQLQVTVSTPCVIVAVPPTDDKCTANDVECP